MTKSILRLGVLGVLWIVATPVMIYSVTLTYSDGRIALLAILFMLVSLLTLMLSGNGSFPKGVLSPVVSRENLGSIGWHLSRLFFCITLTCFAGWGIGAIRNLFQIQHNVSKEVARPDVLIGAGIFCLIFSTACSTLWVVGVVKTISRCLRTASHLNGEWLKMADLIDSGPVVSPLGPRTPDDMPDTLETGPAADQATS